MPNHQDFYCGIKRAYVPPEKILAHNMQSNKEEVANIVNGAFKLYYDGHQSANRISAVLLERRYSQSARKQIEDLQWAMQKDLRDTANSNIIVADLLTCFRHLESTNGHWRDTIVSGWGGMYNIPLGIANFLDSVAEKLKAINNSAADWEASQRHLKRLAEEKKWSELPDQLDKTSRIIEYVGPKLWAGLGVAGNEAENYTKSMTKVFGLAGHVHAALDLGLKVRYSSNAQQTAFIEAMAFVVRGLPVFGSVYGDVLRGVPAMVTFFQRVARQRYRAIGL